MTCEIVIRPDAKTDIDEAFLWCENQRSGLGVEFLQEVDIVLNRIASDPDLVAPFYRDLRRRTLARFPYVAIYVFCTSAVPTS